MRLPKVGKNIRFPCPECPSRTMLVLDIEKDAVCAECVKCKQVYKLKIRQGANS